MGKLKSSKTSRTVVVELSHSSIHAAICESSNGEESIRCLSLPWREEATILHSTLGLNELTAALVQLVRRENLHGQRIIFLLDGEHSVTRQVRGTELAVSQRLDELESLCSRYLLLGNGRKLAARQVEVQNEGIHRGVLSVASERTLHSVCTAADRAGLRVASVSTSIVHLGALIGEICPEEMRSGLLVRPRETGVDIAIIDEGRLLLEVHPVNDMKFGEVCAFIDERTALLQRFFQRHSASRHRRLTNLLVCSDSKTIETVRDGFTNSELQVCSIGQQLEAAGWPVTTDLDLATYGGAIAALLGAVGDTTVTDRPDLLLELDLVNSRSTGYLLAMATWPLAAAILVAVILSGLTAQERAVVVADKAAVEKHQELSDTYQIVGSEISELVFHVRQILVIKEQLRVPDYYQLLTEISSCLAEQTALTSVDLDADGTLTLNAVCIDKESVFQFVHALSQLQSLEKAALQGTTRSRNDSEDRIEFTVHANLRRSAESVPGASRA